MRKLVLAELMLSLVMPRDRAAAVAGDFAEASQGTLSFAIAILRTLLGAILDQQSLGLFFRVVVLRLLWVAAIRLVFGLMVTQGRQVLGLDSILGNPFAVVGFLLIPVLAGYLVARATPGREIPAWASLCAVMLVSAALSAAPVISRSQMWLQIFAAMALPTPTATVLMFFGVLAARRRYLRIA